MVVELDISIEVSDFPFLMRYQAQQDRVNPVPYSNPSSMHKRDPAQQPIQQQKPPRTYQEPVSRLPPSQPVYQPVDPSPIEGLAMHKETPRGPDSPMRAMMDAHPPAQFIQKPDEQPMPSPNESSDSHDKYKNSYSRDPEVTSLISLILLQI